MSHSHDNTDPGPFAPYADEEQWVGVRRIPRENGKVDKVPINPHNGTNASTTNPDTWGTLAQALDMQRRVGLDGIGIVFHKGNNLSGTDLDDCRDPETGEITPEAQAIIDQLDSYTEISQSERGVKIFHEGKLSEPIQYDRDGLKVEIYSAGRHFMVTGQHLAGTPTTIEQRQGELVLLAHALKPEKEKKRQRRGTASVETITAALDGAGYRYHVKQGDKGQIISLDGCLTSDAHDDGGYFICRPDGTASYGCFHNSCADKGWSDAAAALGLPVEEVDPLPFSDEANAQRLIALHGRYWRHCAETKTDFLYNGKRWEKDRTGEIVRRAKDVGRSYLDAAKSPLLDADDCKKLANLGATALDEPRIRRMIALAGVDERIAITTDQLDTNPFLLNTPTGTLDLRTGERHAHRRDDLITKMTAAPYEPWARSDEWDRFLIAATEGIDALDGAREPNPEAAERRAFLQRLAGMGATGDASEEVAVLVHGPTRAGKGTFISPIQAALGDYAITTDFETFLKRPTPGGIRTDLVRLAGARMVVSSEVDDGRELAAALFKRVTGGDRQTARGLYTSEIEWLPTQTFWLVVNHAPGMDAADAAIWERILRVEFPHTVPPEKRDPGLKKRLTDPSIGGPAVLNWIVEGCRAWLRDGLNVPKSVRESTKRLREEMDTAADFFSDECEFAPDASIAYSDLWGTYQLWARQSGNTPMTRPQFLARLRDRGCQPARATGGTRSWRGVKLRERGQAEPINPFKHDPGDEIIDLTQVRRPAG